VRNQRNALLIKLTDTKSILLVTGIVWKLIDCWTRLDRLSSTNKITNGSGRPWPQSFFPDPLVRDALTQCFLLLLIAPRTSQTQSQPINEPPLHCVHSNETAPRHFSWLRVVLATSHT